MQEYLLKTEKINKKFRDFTALKDVTISLEKGKVYGLIGKNGAGKTSLMRIISGLSFATSGEYELFGCSNKRDIQKVLKKVGCLIEYPRLNENMTAKENLELHKIMRGIRNKSLENELLELVGLGDTGKKKTKDFSLGMRQRLGIAVAMLGNPELLILDEPINGLDPLGVVEIRNLIKKLCEERGITILISSHNLPELYQTATNYIIIDRGEVRKIMRLDELEDECQHYYIIKTKQVNKLLSVLGEKLKTKNYKVMDDGTVRVMDFVNEEEMLAQTLFDNGIVTTGFTVGGDSLESYFIRIVGGVENV